MKQLFRLAVILFSLVILVACGVQDTIQVKQISEIATSSITVESKDLMKVSSNKNKRTEDDTETDKVSEGNENGELAAADSSESNMQDGTQITAAYESANSKPSTDSGKSKNSTSKAKSNSSNQSIKSGKTAAKDKSSVGDDKNTVSSKQTTKPKQGSKPKPKENETTPAPAPKSTAFVSVESSSDLNGPNFASTEVEITDGETAFAATVRALKSKGISIDYTGSGSTAYVKGIGGLGEFDAGPLSGWNVYVEGIMIPRSADAYEIFNGYKIHWKYTKNYLKN